MNLAMQAKPASHYPPFGIFPTNEKRGLSPNVVQLNLSGIFILYVLIEDWNLCQAPQAQTTFQENSVARVIPAALRRTLAVTLFPDLRLAVSFRDGRN
jgi:hypothetical protein